MIYLLLAILSSAAISIFMRISSQGGSRGMGMFCCNYTVCMAMAIFYADFKIAAPNHPEFFKTVVIGAICGALFLINFLLLRFNIMRSGVVLSSLFMKLGLLVPILLSIAVYGEAPTVLQLVGFAAAVVAIVLMNFEKQSGTQKANIPQLLLLLFLGGCGVAMSKVFERHGAAEQGDMFLFYTFFTAFLLCIAIMAVKKQPLCKNDILFGLLIGVPNFFSSKFLLLALGKLPAVIVYPSFSVGTILTVTAAGVLFFKERLTTRQAAALAVILAALAMLNA